MLAQRRLDEAFEDIPVRRDGDVAPFPQGVDAPIAAPLAAPQPAQDADALLELRQLADPDADPGDDAQAWHLPPPGIHTTGTQLRRRLVTPESIAELAAHTKPSLIQRILRRR